MFVTSKEMLEKAKKGGYAVGAFNAENMEMVQAIISAAEEENAPVIIQTTPSTVKYASGEIFFGNVLARGSKSSVPIALHLDHGDSLELVEMAIEAGYSSIMIDGSKLDLEENIAITKKAKSMAKFIPVEGELGRLGGKEDDLVVEEGDAYTDVEEAKRFVRETGVDSLAIAVGTAHGFYEGTPHIEMERISEIAKAVSVPLVLHGASGISDADVAESVSRGICKVNFATELRVAFSQGVKEYIKKDPTVYDPKKYNAVARENVKAIVKARMAVCGCVGKA